MKKFFLPCKFCKQTIHFLAVIIVYLRNVLNMSRRRVNNNNLTCWYVLKSFWRHFCETSWRCLEDIFARRFENDLKTFWKRLEYFLKTYVLKTSVQDGYFVLEKDILKMFLRFLKDVFARRLEDVLKTFWKHLEDVLKTLDQNEYIFLYQDVLKMS